MKIAFIYIAEPYQCYHTASVASALAAIPGHEVVEYYSFPETVKHLARIRRALDVPDLPLKAFPKSLKARLLKRARRLDQERLVVLRENIAELNQYDAVVATEYTAGVLKEMGLCGPKLILLMHGAGDRYVNDEHLVRDFDLTLVPGPKVESYFQDKGLLKQETTRVVGYPKFDVFEAVQREKTIAFGNGRPFALYNPHYQRKLTSASGWMMPLIRGFKAQSESGDSDYNLVVAPHIKTFHKGFGIRERQLKRQRSPEVMVDTGSSAMLDMTYTSQAALYIGDVSSQVYEFLGIPRPCVFLNPRKLPWRDDPYFLHWTLGEVVEDLDDLMPAIARAQERHAAYRPAQENLFQETFGTPLLGGSQRAADAIAEFMAAA
ncbi:CDP-glycerol glycerophosphotransferase family protein [Gluconobacter sp. Dm-73]|uniref:CDP-glycerol glycerophosphotransferase family protein n=1 Tax=Gluconobacter sp. Dm-73 TaxID=2799802 RepID=UPI001B8D7D29|nr:CDP-glycerol glycerophosphotransferase family protein [Gluconobacter sp. Dm-73]MBS1074154.1 CDP-glycerol glycerophosphotransferase family protein [Gluconobacter sp. Dm-73]